MSSKISRLVWKLKRSFAPEGKHPELKPDTLVSWLKDKFNLEEKTAKEVYQESLGNGVKESYRLSESEEELVACFIEFEDMEEYFDYVETEILPKYK